jgi:predicted O-linked N-acetylglucosamine transferase (SPINDLY family)
MSELAEPVDDIAAARALVERAPLEPEAWIELTRALLSAGQDAIAAGEQAVKAGPDNARAFEYLGVALKRAGRREESEARFRRSLALDPACASTHSNLANLLKDMGRTQEAVDAYRVALELDPTLTITRFNLALALVARGEREEPQELLRRVAEEAPDFAEGQTVLGVLSSERGKWAQAETALRRSVALNPHLAPAHFHLAVALFHRLRPDESVPHLQQAIRLDPDNGMFRAFEVIQSLPAVPKTREEAAAAPEAFARALQAYAAWRAGRGPRAINVDSIERPPFLLTYREGDQRELLSRFADEVGPPRRFTAMPRPPRRPRLRLGIVSECFRHHSVWDVITKGLLTQLDRSRFEVYLYHLGARDDEQTTLAKSLADRWYDVRSVNDPARWAATIEADQPDVLFYPAIGLDTQSYLLARERLAPVQATAWGHPITSGLATMDLFFSGELIEPPQAEAHYRERLVRLPGTGACTAAAAPVAEPLPPAWQEELEQRTGPRILVPQTPYKFAPGFDAVLARIVKAVGPCTLFIPRVADWGPAYDALAARLRGVFREHGADLSAVLKFIPWLPAPQFNTLLDEADVLLDCTSFSGYTTAWVAAQRGAPMVTLEGPFLRQRLAAGLHRKLGITDTVVDSEDAYVRVAAAVALEGRDSPAGRARRQALRAAAPSLDGDVGVVRMFERTLAEAVEAQR